MCSGRDPACRDGVVHALVTTSVTKQPRVGTPQVPDQFPVQSRSDVTERQP